MQWQGRSVLTSMDELQRKYSELTLETRELEKDQIAIRRPLQEHEFSQECTRMLLDSKSCKW